MVSPKEWGENAWNLLHGIAERVGNQTNKNLIRDEQNELRLTLRHFWALLPCKKCQTHYREYINISFPNTTLYNGYLQDSVREWVYTLHEHVNKERDIVSGVTLDTLQEKYMLIDIRASASRLKSIYQRGLQSGVFKPEDWKIAWKHLDYLLRCMSL